MNFNILTIFPEIFEIFEYGVLSKAIDNNLSVKCYDIRNHAVNKHGQIDAKPYGGGEGMLMMPEPLKNTIIEIPKKELGHVVYLSPQGKKLNQNKVIELSSNGNLTVICGRYEGVDERFIDKYVDEEISIGDFIMSGGEYGAICLIDSIARNLPGTIGNQNSVDNDSFSNGFLKGPAILVQKFLKILKFPEVLLSGNHSKIKDWKEVKSLLQDLFKKTRSIK